MEDVIRSGNLEREHRMKHMSAGCWKGLHDLFDIQKRLGLRDVSALGDLSADTLDHDFRIRENSFFGQAFHNKTARSSSHTD